LKKEFEKSIEKIFNEIEDEEDTFRAKVENSSRKSKNEK